MITVTIDYSWFYNGEMENETMNLGYLPRIGETLILPASLYKQEDLLKEDQNDSSVYFKVIDILYYQEYNEIELRLGNEESYKDKLKHDFKK